VFTSSHDHHGGALPELLETPTGLGLENRQFILVAHHGIGLSNALTKLLGAEARGLRTKVKDEGQPATTTGIGEAHHGRAVIGDDDAPSDALIKAGLQVQLGSQIGGATEKTHHAILRIIGDDDTGGGVQMVHLSNTRKVDPNGLQMLAVFSQVIAPDGKQ